MEAALRTICIFNPKIYTAKAISWFLAQKATKLKSVKIIVQVITIIIPTIYELRSVGRVLLAVLIITLLKQGYPATIPPYVPLLAVRFIGGVVAGCNDYNT